MQTFMPAPTFSGSLVVLDRQRLGKQRVEAKQLLRALRGESKGWVNHPATKMWRGHEGALALYGRMSSSLWLSRGYRDSLLPYFIEMQREHADTATMPPWMGDAEFHRSHQSNLIRKLPDHYGPLWPGVPADLPYLWPHRMENQ